MDREDGLGAGLFALPPIKADANKYTRGSLLIVAGSTRFPGAAVLAAKAAERAGAGYVSLAVPASVASVAQGHLLTVPVIAAGDTGGVFAADALPGILSSLNHSDAILCGPGMTANESTAAFLGALFAEAKVPLVLDADAINLLGWPLAGDGANGAVGAGLLWEKLPPDAVLTPHAGELARLQAAVGGAPAGAKTSSVAEPGGTEPTEPTELDELAKRLQATIVAKGPETRVYPPKRAMQPFVYTDGTPALAKAGTGDVLAGIIAALIAQGMQPFHAAQTGVLLHGRAGRLVEANSSRRSLIASDIIDALSHVFYEIEGI